MLIRDGSEEHFYLCLDIAAKAETKVLSQVFSPEK
jgi:hypothetical protein